MDEETKLATVSPVHDKVTMYLRELWGYYRVEASDVTWRSEQYAQYRNAARVEYTPRGKRKRETAMITTTPLVILEGWGHPDPPVKTGPAERLTEHTVVRTTRRPACDPEWDHEFQAFLDGYLAGSKAPVIADFRSHDPQSK